MIRRYQPQQMRLLVHWSAEVYSDIEELEMNLDRSRDLTFDVVFERSSPTYGRAESKWPSRPTRCTTATSFVH